MSSVLESPVEASVEESPYLISVDEFHRMLEAEVFPSEARVGLWEGRIYEKMAKTRAHAVASINATTVLARLLPPGWCLSGENPISIGPDKAPLPDLIVLRGKGKDYIGRRPEPADVGLAIELSLSSLGLDTGPRLADHARAGIATYWALNLKDNLICVYESPVPAEGRHASSKVVDRDGSIPFILDGTPIAMIAAPDLLPIN